VFKCLTDTIMLDDFKTELKRLGIKRMQKDEQRRQSFALVLDDKDEDDDREVEFADALNTNPARFNGKRASNRIATTNNADSSPRGLRQNSIGVNGSADTGGGPKSMSGRGGMKIAHLPGLKSLGFESIKPGRKSRRDREDGVQDQGPLTDPKQNVSSVPNPSPDRVNRMRQSLGAIDFNTKPEGY
jgi:hypothetical protein